MSGPVRIDPPIPLMTERGSGLAHFLIDYGAEHDLIWVMFMDDTGECWSVPNPKVRAQKNITMGRTLAVKPKDRVEVKLSDKTPPGGWMA